MSDAPVTLGGDAPVEAADERPGGPGALLAVGPPKNGQGSDPPGRYRHPGDVIRLILSGVVLAAAVVVAALLPSRLLGPRATLFTAMAPDTAGGELLTGLVQLTLVAAFVAVVVALLRRARFRRVGGGRRGERLPTLPGHGRRRTAPLRQGAW